MKRNERLLASIGNIDEKFIEEAEGKMKKSKNDSRGFSRGKIIRMVASFIVVIGLGLFLFWPTQYQPLIDKIEPYRYQATKKPYANNFELGWMFVRMLGNLFIKGGTDMAPGDVPEYEAMGDAYVESTDNQVAGIIEADMIKTTENYLFRRTICDLPTNALNKIFLMLHKDVMRYDGTDDNYVAKLKYALLAKKERARFPDDAEFAESFSTMVHTA